MYLPPAFALEDPIEIAAFVRTVGAADLVTVGVHGLQATLLPVLWDQSPDDAPEAFISGQLRAIIGVELIIERVEAKAKWSQNRGQADRAAVVAHVGDPVAELLAAPSLPACTTAQRTAAQRTPAQRTATARGTNE
jgi:predicted FMN-binding regulatory protein PaiB